MGLTNSWTPISFAMQVADVSKPLGSVYQFTEANNMVVFDKGNSYIVNKSNGKRTPIAEENGVFYLDVWVPKKKGTDMCGAVTDSSQDKGFAGQASFIP